MANLEELNSEQLSALNAIRLTFMDQDGIGMAMNDSTYIRYLRARNYDVEKATKMLRATLKWRKEFGLEDIHTKWTETVAYENSSGKMYVRGFDKNGHAVLYLKPGKENSKNHDGNLKHLVYNLERAIACMDESTKQEKVVLIIDYDGFSMSRAPATKTSIATLNILQDHYPERLYRAFIIRPMYFFYLLFQMISGLMDAVTKAKLVMLTNKQLADADNQLFKQVPYDRLEFTVTEDKEGTDHRPFDSELYMAGKFSKEFLSLRNDLDKEETAAEIQLASNNPIAMSNDEFDLKTTLEKVDNTETTPSPPRVSSADTRV